MNKELTPLEHLEFIRNYEIDDKHRTLNMNYATKQSLDIIETTLEEKEQQDSVLKTLKEVIEFEQVLPHIEPNKDNGFDIMSAVRIDIQRDIENRERELFRNWILETCFPKELKEYRELKTRNYELLKESEHFYNQRNEYKRALEIIKDEFTIRFNDNKQEITLQSLSYPYTSAIREIKDKSKYDLLKKVLI